MKHTHKKLAQAISLAIATTAPASLLAAVELDFYGSARVQAESVSPDSGTSYVNGGNDSYIGLRDAYSRIGMNLGWQASDAVKVFGQLEIPLDIANFAVQDPYNDQRDIRVAQIGVNTEHGTLAYGQMWLPFYNAISYKVDRFSTYYSGYATLAFFRAYNAISYYSPDYDGFSFGGGIVIGTDSDRADSFEDNRYQLTASYNKNGTDLSIGIDQVDDTNNTRLIGAALGQQIDQLYIGIKLEQWNAKGAKELNVMNLYADYQLNHYTFKGMIAEVDGFGGQILHLGADYQYSKNLKTFIEFYQQEELNAISNRKMGGGGSQSFIGSLNGGGKALAVGFRYDF
ncbi:porin [Thiomicrospira microaerophila]|uniref:porin n=1 Tax=Thiomicrospira microaerophila TaxID=406020 RepID=UPI00200F7C53|nr:porin [Thiomicrospira microaerophila]UQB41854.1 porin [Thiomicrospira microaerophila]